MRRVLIAILLVCAACGGGDSELTGEPTTTPTSDSETTTTTAAPTTTPTTAPTTADAPSTTTTTAPPTTSTSTETTDPDAEEVSSSDSDTERELLLVQAVLSVRASSSFVMLSEVFTSCLEESIAADATSLELVEEMAEADSDDGLSPEAAELAARCMARPGYLQEVRDSWTTDETTAEVNGCLDQMFSTNVDEEEIRASLLERASSAKLGTSTMEEALLCVFDENFLDLLEQAGLTEITAEESSCVRSELSKTSGRRIPVFPIMNSCLGEESMNRTVGEKLDVNVKGDEGACIVRLISAQDDPVGASGDQIVAYAAECGFLGEIARSVAGSAVTDEVARCVDDEAENRPVEGNSDLSDILNDCVNR